MLELLVGISVAAVALTFLTDATSYTLKMARAGKRRARIHTAHPAASDH